MHRWKAAAAVTLLVGAVAALAIFAPRVVGQDRSVVLPRAEREARLASWFGSQIGVTVREPESSAGVVVEDVRRDSPAEEAGVKQGDVIVEFDGERVRSTRQFARLVDETPQGKSVKMVLERNGQRTTLDVKPEGREFGRILPAPLERFHLPELPPAPPPLRYDFDRGVGPDLEIFSSSARPGRLGVQIEDLEDQLAEYFGVKSGVLVTSVSKDSPAGRSGLKAGDVITKVADELVNDTGDVRREIRRIQDDREFTIEVMRDRKPMGVKVKLDPPRTQSRKPGTVTEWF